MFWSKRRQEKPDVVPKAYPSYMDDPPMDDDYVPAEPTKIKPLEAHPGIRRDQKIQKITREPELASVIHPDGKETKVETYRVLFRNDGNLYAIGPFQSEREAAIWCNGLRTAESDYHEVIGIFTQIKGMQHIEILELELQDC